MKSATIILTIAMTLALLPFVARPAAADQAAVIEQALSQLDAVRDLIKASASAADQAKAATVGGTSLKASTASRGGDKSCNDADPKGSVTSFSSSLSTTAAATTDLSKVVSGKGLRGKKSGSGELTLRPFLSIISWGFNSAGVGTNTYETAAWSASGSGGFLQSTFFTATLDNLSIKFSGAPKGAPLNFTSIFTSAGTFSELSSGSTSNAGLVPKIPVTFNNPPVGTCETTLFVRLNETSLCSVFYSGNITTKVTFKSPLDAQGLVQARSWAYDLTCGVKAIDSNCLGL